MVPLSFLTFWLLLSLWTNALSIERAPSRCASLQAPQIPGARVLSITHKEAHNLTVSTVPPLLLTNVTGLDVCQVDVWLTHPGAADKVRVQVWLPLNDWNGRFLATGGTGFAAGIFDLAVAPVVALGYAAASTDAGLPGGDPSSPAAWALNSTGQVDAALLENFASRSIHDMAVVGKAVTKQFYNQAPKNSYWSGCSTGGRQGLVAAQRYPTDFDGIVAGAPANNWAKYVVAEHWPQVVMKEAGVYPTNCELSAFQNASIAACDALDGTSDDVISDLRACAGAFDPYHLVGETITCPSGPVTISNATAAVVAKILFGPVDASGFPLWYPLHPGAPLEYLTNTTLVDGKRTGAPFFVNDAWIKFFLLRDPKFNTAGIGYRQFEELFYQSARQYDDVISAADPDLSRFRDAGGKFLVWHGLSDQLIFPQGSVDYRIMVQEALNASSEKVDEFYRLFMAPGVDHCGLGLTHGAVPVDPLAAVVEWVEEKKAPESLGAKPVGVTEEGGWEVCKWPSVAGDGGQGKCQ